MKHLQTYSQIFLILTVLTSSCSRSIDGLQTIREKKIKSTELFIADTLKFNYESFIASSEKPFLTDKQNKIISPEKKFSAPFEMDWSADNMSSCDTLILISGQKLSVKVTEINSVEIKYKDCGNLGGPANVMLKDDVRLIKYSNGTENIFNTEIPSEIDSEPHSILNVNPIKPSTQSTHWTAVLAMGLGMLSILLYGFIIGFFAIIFSLIALRIIKKHPEKYKGKKMAIAGLILGITGIILWTCFLIWFVFNWSPSISFSI